jgi:hypothetical protein
MLEADYLRQKAEACYQLSRSTFDLSIAGRLRAIADDLQRKAAEIEREKRADNGSCAARASGNGSKEL